MAMPSKLFRAIIIGPPGSGKGTIAKRIGLTHLASGDVLRRQVAEKSEIGLAAEKYINEGSLVPDNLMMKLVLSELRGECQYHYDYQYWTGTVSETQS